MGSLEDRFTTINEKRDLRLGASILDFYFRVEEAEYKDVVGAVVGGLIKAVVAEEFAEEKMKEVETWFENSEGEWLKVEVPHNILKAVGELSSGAFKITARPYDEERINHGEMRRVTHMKLIVTCPHQINQDDKRRFATEIANVAGSLELPFVQGYA